MGGRKGEKLQLRFDSWQLSRSAPSLGRPAVLSEWQDGQLNFNFHSDDADKNFKLFLIYCQSKLPFFLKLHKRAIILNTIVDHLYHNDEDDKEDEVSVEVGVGVPLLLLVETHLPEKM